MPSLYICAVPGLTFLPRRRETTIRLCASSLQQLPSIPLGKRAQTHFIHPWTLSCSQFPAMLNRAGGQSLAHMFGSFLRIKIAEGGWLEPRPSRDQAEAISHHGEKGTGCGQGTPGARIPGSVLPAHTGAYKKCSPLTSGLGVDDSARPCSRLALQKCVLASHQVLLGAGSPRGRVLGGPTHHQPSNKGCVGTACLEQHLNPQWLQGKLIFTQGVKQ